MEGNFRPRQSHSIFTRAPEQLCLFEMEIEVSDWSRWDVRSMLIDAETETRV